MADVRCPMCGKTNPAGSETCGYCSARLVMSGPPAPGAPQDGSDWLNEFRSASSEGTSLEGPRDSGESQETPDWLAGFRLTGELHPETDSTPGGAGQEQVPDWLRDLKDETAPAQPAGGEDGAPDWLAGLRSEAVVGAQGEEPPPAPAQEEPLPPAAESPAPAGQDNDWLRSFETWQPESETPAAAPEQASPSSEDNDWLRSFQTWQPEAQIPAEAAPETQEPSPAPPAQGTSDSGWLQNLQNWGIDGTQPEEEEAPPPGLFAESPAAGSGQAGEGLPAWLSGLQPETPAAEPLQPTSIPPIAGEELEPASWADLPDWLSSETGAEESPAPQPGAAPTGEEAGLPDWLSGISSAAPAEPFGEPAAVPSAAAPLTGVTGWLQSFREEAAAAQPVEETPADEGGFGVESALFTAPPEPGLPAAGDKLPPPVSPFTGSGLPDWLAELQPSAQAETPLEEEPGGEEAPHPFSDEGIPNWFAGQAAEAAPPAEGAGNIAAAQIPVWLQAMRPLEAVVAETSAQTDDGRVERSGPLAGLRSVLPAEEAAVQYKKPPVHSLKLQVSESQRRMSDLLATMLETEKRPAAAQAQKSRLSQRAMRILAGLMLLVFVLSVLLLSPAGTPPPVMSAAPAVRSFQQALEALPEGAPVLLAMDYEPAFQGELGLASQGALVKLMEKKARLVVLSTTPSGALLGAQTIRTAHARLDAAAADYALKDQVVNLGYLPGGEVSLQELALDLHRAIPYGLNAPSDGRIAWENPAVQGINRLSDFALVLVVADSVENGRAWVEQVQPSLSGITPLLLIASAQSAPLMQPYVDSSQVQGMLGGLADGIAFDQLLAVRSAHSSLWNGVQTGVFVVILLVFLGMVFELVQAFTRSRAKPKS